MKEEAIAEIGIDEGNRLYVRPTSSQFPEIYRTASGVHWNPELQVLYSPEPREWSYSRWFEQIVSAVSGEYGIDLKLDLTTQWANISDEDRRDIEAY